LPAGKSYRQVQAIEQLAALPVGQLGPRRAQARKGEDGRTRPWEPIRHAAGTASSQRFVKMMFCLVELRGLKPLTPCLQRAVISRDLELELAVLRAVSNRAVPLSTGVNGTLMARQPSARRRHRVTCMRVRPIRVCSARIRPRPARTLRFCRTFRTGWCGPALRATPAVSGRGRGSAGQGPGRRARWAAPTVPAVLPADRWRVAGLRGGDGMCS
jgi:hypothetical protein